MKTVDLIPLILLELKDGDKYGFELTKNIETKSNGNIIIKQPTLYTLLKKLEKSKFISSYWQDSEIGGKRHYYRLTENGKLQADTLPSYEELLTNSSQHEEDYEDYNNSNAKTVNVNYEPLETIIPSSEVFSDSSQSKETELSINISNLEVIKEEKPEEKFAESKKVEKFTQKFNSTPPQQEFKSNIDIEDKFKAIEEKKFFEISDKKSKTENYVRFNDYIDFKNNLEYQQQKSITKRTIFKAFVLSFTMLSICVALFIATNKTGRSVMFYIYSAIALFVVILCPIITMINIKRHKELKVNHLKIYLSLTFILLTLITSIIVSVSIGKDSISTILSFNNLPNLYAPLFISLVGIIEWIYHKLFVEKHLK